MNATVEPRRRRPSVARRASSVLGAATGTSARVTAIAVWLLFVGGGIVGWQVARDPAKGAHAIVLLGMIGTGLIWALWLTWIVGLQIAGRSSRMPRIDDACGWALGAAFVISVLLPAVLASWAGVDPRVAFGGLVAAAMGGALLILLPATWAVAVFVVPGLLIMVIGFSVIDSGIDALKAYPELVLQLPWLASVLAVVAVWRWRALLHDVDASGTSMHSPLLLSLSAGALAELRVKSSRGAYAAPDWMWPAGQVETRGPARPVRAMRAWLGTPFAPLSRNQWLVQLVGGLVPIGVLVIMGLRFAEDIPRGSGPLIGFGAGAGVAILTLMVLGIMPGVRLAQMRGQKSAEWAELALLPGWGNAAATQSTLLRAVAVPLLQLGALTLAMVAAMVFWFGTDAVGLLWALLAIASVVLTSAVASLRALAGQRFDALWVVALCVVGTTLPSTMLAAALPELRERLPDIVLLGGGIGWLLASAFLLVSGASAWLRIRRQPQPFLECGSRPAAIDLPGFVRRNGLRALLVLLAIGFAIGVVIGNVGDGGCAPGDDDSSGSKSDSDTVRGEAFARKTDAACAGSATIDITH